MPIAHIDLFPILPISIFWAWRSQKDAWRRLTALLVALCSVTSAGFLVHWWWKLYDQTSFNSTFLLSFGLASIGLGLLIKGALWLRSTDYGDDKDRVVIRDNGVPTYLAADIAYHRTRGLPVA